MKTAGTIAIGLMIVFILVTMIGSCTDSSKFDGKIVKDSQSNYYRLKHNIGDTYFIEEISADDIQIFREVSTHE